MQHAAVPSLPSFLRRPELVQGRRKLPEGGAAALRDQSGDAANIEARKDENSARSAEKNFSPSFSVIRMGSRGTFVLYFED